MLTFFLEWINDNPQIMAVCAMAMAFILIIISMLYGNPIVTVPVRKTSVSRKKKHGGKAGQPYLEDETQTVVVRDVIKHRSRCTPSPKRP